MAARIAASDRRCSPPRSHPDGQAFLQSNEAGVDGFFPSEGHVGRRHTEDVGPALWPPGDDGGVDVSVVCGSRSHTGIIKVGVAELPYFEGYSPSC